MVLNLRNIANSQTKSISPNFNVTWYQSAGFVTENYVQSPLYNSIPLTCDVQAMTTGDLRRIEALNIQGAQKALYLNGAALGVNRIQVKGGDLIVFAPGALPEGNIWLVTANLEQWAGATWCKISVTLQDDTTAPRTILTTDLRNPANNVIVPVLLSGV
jgi:hypothetical protein